ncbi:MAG: hypothetical protein QF805_27885, partial [Pirellulaceae bacterium]|nr:hypothetical protein [Pirellulaceae bacterium]
ETAVVGFYDDDAVTPIAAAAAAYESATSQSLALSDLDCLVAALPHGRSHDSVATLAGWLNGAGADAAALRVPVEDVELLVPIARPNKLFLLAG